MYDVVDSTTPMLGATHAAVRAMVSHRLLPPILFLIACVLVLVTTSSHLVRTDRRREVDGKMSQVVSRSITHRPSVLYAYLVPNLRYIQSSVDEGTVQVSLIAAPSAGTDAGPDLHAHVMQGFVDTLVIDTFIWHVTGSSVDGTLILRNVAPASTYAPLPSVAQDGAVAAMKAWGSTPHGSLVLAFKDGTKV